MARRLNTLGCCDRFGTTNALFPRPERSPSAPNREPPGRPSSGAARRTEPGPIQFEKVIVNLEVDHAGASPGVDCRPAHGSLSTGNIRRIFDGIFEM
eukprot:115271-Prorocentrum_minimum.AAC.1